MNKSSFMRFFYIITFFCNFYTIFHCFQTVFVRNWDRTCEVMRLTISQPLLLIHRCVCPNKERKRWSLSGELWFHLSDQVLLNVSSSCSDCCSVRNLVLEPPAAPPFWTRQSAASAASASNEANLHLLDLFYLQSWHTHQSMHGFTPELGSCFNLFFLSREKDGRCRILSSSEV